MRIHVGYGCAMAEINVALQRTRELRFILEFKVRRRTAEPTLADTVKAALHQIRERRYGADLIERGISETRIHRLGIAFDGKSVLIGTDRA